MMKKILVDAVHLLSPKTGIGKYTYENCIRLQNMTVNEINWYYGYGYVSDKLADTENKGIENNNFQVMRKLKSIVTRYSYAKSAAKALAVVFYLFLGKSYDLYWQPNVIPNGAVRADKTVTTVHDLSFLVYPYWHPADRSKYMTKKIFKGIKKSDRVIAVSDFTKAEIVKYAHCDPTEITVIYNGIDHSVFKLYSEHQMQVFKRQHNLPEQYLLFVGSIEPRKNLLRLLRAYKGYAESAQKALPLILVGFKGWQNDEIMQMIHSLSGKVSYLGYLNDQELAYAYNLATIFIYPSLYEGFGIPPLEAMACGTPVITSNVTSIPEVCGEAAVYIDPNDEVDIREKIELLANREDLRSELIQRGLERSREFTWEASAQKHLELFEELMNR